jgi:hypothetical protein
MSDSSGSRRDLSETFSDVLNGCAKGVFYIGAALSLLALGLLVFTCFAVAGGSAAQSADALKNVELFQKGLVVGMLGIGVGSGYLFWGEDLLGALQLMLAAALYFAPLYLPAVLGGKSGELVDKSLGAMQMGGTVLGLIAVPILVFDIVTRTRERIKVGVKADQLKYGKGIKEETTKQNVFMGKCWQLPFCRKFVRERCPIYHSKRTCWKENVGCMCEEQVIRNAMENKPIPKDALLAAKMIPQNHKITLAAKQERCRNCVIYNEHQRHKYKLAVPGVVIFFLAFYGLGRGPLLGMTRGMIEHVDHILQSATVGQAGIHTPDIFVEMLLITFLIVTLSYSMKLLEFLIFKLKV